MDLDNTKAQMKKGILEYCILSILSDGAYYVSDIAEELKKAELLVVEGTLYPLLNRLKKDELLSYHWQESKSGPPRKYYSLTPQGQAFLNELKKTWEELVKSVQTITHKHNAKTY
jgi:PadR family transcriptional regulator PadR